MHQASTDPAGNMERFKTTEKLVAYKWFRIQIQIRMKKTLDRLFSIVKRYVFSIICMNLDIMHQVHKSVRSISKFSFSTGQHFNSHRFMKTLRFQSCQNIDLTVLKLLSHNMCLHGCYYFFIEEYQFRTIFFVKYIYWWLQF